AISGLEAFRRQWKSISIDRVVEFFLFNPTFPRSVLFCVAGADWSLSEIEDLTDSDTSGLAKLKTSELRRRLSLTSVQEVLAGGMHQNVDMLQSSFNEIGDALNEDYFHLPVHA
ncbi:MAG: alpha-E domain-containing protein, partial [Rubripirellula sp.]